MNRIAFEEIKNPNIYDLYDRMWGSSLFDFPVEKTLLNDGSVSNNSYTFTNTSPTNEEICRNRLAELFGIQCRDLFKEKFAQSCGGNGQELKRIGTLHSSALCALLFFYNVTEENPYSMEIGGDEYVFTYSRFEYQNTVIKGRNPSNIDVVLIGTEKASEKPVVLFLESKFSEYYQGVSKQSKEITAAYLDNQYSKALYKDDVLDRMGIRKEKRNDAFILYSTKDACYLEGIKQMISHYIGVRNLCDSSERKDDLVAQAVSAGAKILLGEIFFTKGIGRLHLETGEECFASYRKKYLILADILNEQLKNDGMSEKFTVLGDILSYSQFQNKTFIRESQIKRFYFELGK